jgi:hypothetical protein
MKDNPINLTIPPGARVITIAFGETMEQSDSDVRKAFEKAEKQGVASIALTAENASRKATGIDILRMRGTPIELIGSAIAAEDWETARAAFRTSILEYVYEKVETYCNAHVSFMNSKDLHRKEEQLGLIVEGDGPFSVIGLTPQHDTIPCAGAAVAKVCKVESGEIREPIDDHITASVMAIIEKLTGNIIAEITPPLDKVVAQRGEGLIEVRVIVDLFEFDLKADAKEIIAHVNVPMVAFWAGQN